MANNKKQDAGSSLELNPRQRRSLYARARYLPMDIKEDAGLLIPFDVYVQDPFMAKENPSWGIDSILVGWEPYLDDGPTSSRIAIVDYVADAGTFIPPARWEAKKNRFIDDEDCPVSRKTRDTFQFHQVSVWATIQRAMAFFEDWGGLGRPLGWAFDGNRLIVVPHAGYGKNAFYDRHSKSLQFYYFNDEEGKPVYTCLSADIVHHELGHAILDFMRPHYLEGGSTVQVAAFHEFFGDLSAILLVLRHNKFRNSLVEKWGDLTDATVLGEIAEQFGETVKNDRYLRSAREQLKMKSIEGELRPHYCSQVLTSAMFELMIRISSQYMSEERGRTASEAFWNTIQRMQRTAFQAINLLPPVDVTFKDYALAVIRAEELSNPLDPHGYLKIMEKVFREWGILQPADLSALKTPHYLYHDGDHKVSFDVRPNINSISSSKAAAYRFLHDNRRQLRIPTNQDVIVTDVYQVENSGRHPTRLSRRIVLAYMWRQEVKLDGKEFGELNGSSTSLPCGGTLVLDENGNLLSWFRKPGTQYEKRWDARRKVKRGLQDLKVGEQRLAALQEYISAQIDLGWLGLADDEDPASFAGLAPPTIARQRDGQIHMELSPHLCIEKDDELEKLGDRRWAISF